METHRIRLSPDRDARLCLFCGEEFTPGLDSCPDCGSRLLPLSEVRKQLSPRMEGEGGGDTALGTMVRICEAPEGPRADQILNALQQAHAFHLRGVRPPQAGPEEGPVPPTVAFFVVEQDLERVQAEMSEILFGGASCLLATANNEIEAAEIRGALAAAQIAFEEEHLPDQFGLTTGAGAGAVFHFRVLEADRETAQQALTEIAQPSSVGPEILEPGEAGVSAALSKALAEPALEPAPFPTDLGLVEKAGEETAEFQRLREERTIKIARFCLRVGVLGHILVAGFGYWAAVPKVFLTALGLAVGLLISDLLTRIHLFAGFALGFLTTGLAVGVWMRWAGLGWMSAALASSAFGAVTLFLLMALWQGMKIGEKRASVPPRPEDQGPANPPFRRPE